MLVHAVDTYLERGEKASAWQTRSLAKDDGVIGSDMTIFTIVYMSDEGGTAADLLIEAGPRKRAPETTELSGHLSRTPVICYELSGLSPN